MKDKNGVELAKGDPVLLTIRTPIEHPAEIVIFKEQHDREYYIIKDGEEKEELTCDIEYYPITTEGKEVATFDSGATQTKFHREKKFLATNVKPKDLIKMDSGTFSGYKKTLFDEIVALL